METAKLTDTSAPHLRADSAGASALPAREAYRLWASSYEAVTAVSALDDLAVADLSPGPVGTLLDAGCGTGRRLPPALAESLVVGVDLVVEMLAAGRRPHQRRHRLAAADIRVLPFVAPFDTIWCRLVLGHIPDLSSAYQEFFRVSKSGGRLVVTDFHPEALSAGHARTFRDTRGLLHAVETHPHTMDQHERAATDAGFRLERARDWCVGPDVRLLYQAASALKQYRQQEGMPLVLALLFVR